MENDKNTAFEEKLEKIYNLEEITTDNTSELELGTTEAVDDDPEIDLSEFTPSVCTQQGRLVEKAGVMSIVHSKNGMRVALSRELMERLHHPDTVQFGFSDHQIAISGYLGDPFTSYSMNHSGTKSIIYRSELVKQITDRYMLDFSNRTSITFTEVRYKENGVNPIALIQVTE